MDWNAIGSCATAIGVCFAAWQIWESRKISQTTFEDSIDQRYRDLAMKIPVDALLGESNLTGNEPDIREIIYNYLDLCNEQTFLRKKKRVSELRWEVWCEGIKDNLEKPAFKKVWEEVKHKTPSEFTYLTKLKQKKFKIDPAKW